MLSLRKASDDYIDFYFNVRNVPKVYEGFYTQGKPLTWHEHSNWWHSRNHDWEKFIIVLDGTPIGILNIGQKDHWSPELGYAILPAYWGKGYGTQAVKMALERLKEQGYRYCHTTVVKGNQRSLALLANLGFIITGDARPGELWLTKSL